MINAKEFCIFCKSSKKNTENINYPYQELSLQISYVNRFFVLYRDRNYFIIKFYKSNDIQPDQKFFFNSLILNANFFQTNDLYEAYISFFYEDRFIYKLHNKFKSNHNKNIKIEKNYYVISSSFKIEQKIFQIFLKFKIMV